MEKIRIATEHKVFIVEEFILLSALLWAAIAFKNIEVATGMFIAYAIYLFFHIFQAMQFKKWQPGSRTALIEMAPVLTILIYFFLLESLS